MVKRVPQSEGPEAACANLSDQVIGRGRRDRARDLPKRGELFVLSAASGCGKSSLAHAVVELDDDLVLSISHTTRQQRLGEVAGYDYYYVTEQLFHQMVQEQSFLEYARIFDHYYGTSKVVVEGCLVSGKDVLLEIDWQGAQRIRELMSCTTIFVLPPSPSALQSRLRKRGREAKELIDQRLAVAREDMAHYKEFDYLIVNQHFGKAISELYAIIQAQRLKRARQAAKYQALLHSLVS